MHERALRITYGDESSSSQDPLKKDNSVSIHLLIQAIQRNVKNINIQIAKT